MKTCSKLLLLSTVMFAFSVKGIDNLTAKFDPGFESGTKYWYPFPKNNGAAFVKGKGSDQSCGLVFASPLKTATANVYRKGFVPVKSGRIYTLEAKFNSTISSGKVSLLARFWSGTKNGQQVKGSKSVGEVRSDITESTNCRWSVVRCTFKVPEKADGVHIGFRASQLKGEIAFDDVRFYETSGKHIIPLIDKAPALNGKVDREFLKKATKLTDFMRFPVARKELVADQTEAYLAMTTDEICGQILLYHPKEYPLKKTAAPRDSLKIFGSDSIEFFITYTGREGPYYHICINANGDLFDSLGLSGSSWSSGIKTAVGKVSDTCYLIAFQLPLKNIGYNHVLDKGLIIPSWKLNVSRNHRNRPKSLWSSWKAFKGSFHDVQNYDWFTGMGTRSGAVYSDRFHADQIAGAKFKEKQLGFWPVKNKEYESLFSGKYSPYRGKSAFIWSHPVGSRMIDFALQYGIEYNYEMLLKEYEKGALLPYMTASAMLNKNEAVFKYAKETKNGFVLYYPYMDFRYTFSCIYNPHTRKELHKWTREQLIKYPGHFWGISIGDEATEHLASRMIQAINDPARVKKDPYLRAAIKEIKEKYGYGKFGAPPDPKAKARFQWIAIKKYVFAKVLEIQKELYQLCQEFKRPDGKNLVCISADPMGGLNVLQNQSREKDYCDIFTAQCLPQLSTQRQTIAFATKILKDTTGKTVWPCVHFEPYYYSHDAETTAAYLSEVSRGGGTGIQIWNSDYVGKVRKMGCSEIDYFGHRPRWDTMIDIVNRFRTMPLLKYPEPDFAYYLSNDTIYSFWTPLFQDCEALFSLLGPSAGTWFKFISGNQLEDNEIDLKKWKVIFIAKADIELPGNQKKFLDYVKNGGTLICFDPEVFKYSPDGTVDPSIREQIFGVKTVPSKEVLFSFVKHPYTKNILKDKISANPGFALKPMKGTDVLATYLNKSAAVTMKKYPGGGKAILFASPLKFNSIAQKEWHELLKQIVRKEGLKTDHKIWNFSFPFKKEVQPVIKEKCYTNNHFYWWFNEPVTSANIRLKGATYQYNIAPADSKQLVYSFAKGRLTNRIPALTTGDLACNRNRPLFRSGKLHRGLFVDTWTDEAPLKIRFDFKKKIPVTKIVIFYTGCLPGFSAVFPNGKIYSRKGAMVDHVKRLELNVPETFTDKVDLVIDQRILGELLTISEVEIWGNARKK